MAVIPANFATAMKAPSFIVEAQMVAFNFDVVFTPEEVSILTALRSQQTPAVAAMMILMRRWDNDVNEKTVLGN
jgi:hypothetical protein